MRRVGRNQMKHLLQPACLVAICCGTGATLWAGQPNAADPSPPELLDEIRALRAEVKELRARVAAPQPTTQSNGTPQRSVSTREVGSQETIDQVLDDSA